MSISANTKQVLLENLYYSPNTQYTSIKSLYSAVKNKGITNNEVRDFIQNQESSQLFKKAVRIKHYCPIVAKYKFEILQADIADMSNIATANRNYNYLLVVVDVFSRFAFVIPLKNKRADTITEAITEIIKETEPKTITTDLGSEFISNSFRKLLERQGTEINYVEVGDHKRLGIVDRFIRTLREKLNKYMAMHNTTTYIDVLQKIVYNYNNTYHSGIKNIPAEVSDQDKDVIKITNQKYNKAKLEEIKFNVNDNVRCITNLKAFEKKSLPKWSKTVHKIVDTNQHSYKLDNDKTYKYYELQKVDNVQKFEKLLIGPTIETMRKQNSIKRKQKKESIDLGNIINENRKRNRLATDRLNYVNM